MKIALQATPEALAGHGLSITVLEHTLALKVLIGN